MRRLLWLTLGFTAASVFCAYGRMPVLLALPAFVLLGAMVSPEHRKQKLLLSVLGILWGLLWFARFEETTLRPVYALDGVTREAEIRCSSFPEDGGYGLRAEGTITIEDRDYAVLCFLKSGEELLPGNRITGPFRFRVTAPGGERESAYYQGEGTFLLAYQQSEIRVTEADPTWRDRASGLRQKLLEILREALPEDAAGFAGALLLGDSSGLDYETKTNLTVSGIRHIVAVSGLHVSILYSLVSAAAFRRRFLTVFLMGPALVLFAAMTGFAPSVSRACIMSGLMAAGSLVNREYDGASALSFAGLVLLLGNPLAVTSVSYQLSFASVAGIFLFSTRIRMWLQPRLPKPSSAFSRYLTASVSVTLGATVFTVPLCALHFGTVSLAAAVTNLLVLWLVSILFYGLMALCLLHLIGFSGTGMLAGVLTLLIRFVLGTAGIIAAFPLSAVYTRSPYILAWLVFCGMLLGIYFLLRNRYPSRLFCCAVLGLSLAILASWWEMKFTPVRFTVLDVGQGQCLLLESDGKTCLVDCGGTGDQQAADIAAETLLSRGIHQLDCCILTHHHRDHAGGLGELLSRVDTQLLILPPVFSGETYPAAETLYASEDLCLSTGKTNIQIFAPEFPGKHNENSICILFDTENCDILVTGDRSFAGEQSLLKRSGLPDVDILVAGHHGAKDATGDPLLQAVRPEIVCISGAPAPELLQRLESHGCTLYRTDLHGDIIIRR